jgi:hypothetical protein
MKMKVAGLTRHGIEESSVYQAILQEGYREGFRACFAQTCQDTPEGKAAGHLYEEHRWFDFNEIRGWMMLRERFGEFVAERK